MSELADLPDPSAEIVDRLDVIRDAISATNERLDRQAAGINAIGENLQWLVQNTQGIFQMFSNPAFISQMSNALMGGLTNGRDQD